MVLLVSISDDYNAVSFVILSSPYIFVWKLFNINFLRNLSKLKQYKTSSDNVVLYNILTVLSLITFFLISAYNNDIIINLVNIPSIAFDKRNILIVIQTIARTWLSFFMMTSLIFIAIIIFCLIQEFQQLNKQLNHLIDSSKIYEPGSFPTWTKIYGDVANLVDSFNENIKLYLAHGLIASLVNTMAVLYLTVVSCKPQLQTIMWIIQFFIQTMVIMIPGVILNNQV